MSKYEIEIDGLPDGWEPEKLQIDYREGDACAAYLKLRLKVRKYDWSKTLEDVLVLRKFREGAWSLLGARGEQSGLALCWQPNIHGKCPVDPDACVVRVRKCGDPHVYEEGLAGSFNWSFLLMAGEVIASWQFIRLADNVEW